MGRVDHAIGQVSLRQIQHLVECMGSLIPRGFGLSNAKLGSAQRQCEKIEPSIFNRGFDWSEMTKTSNLLDNLEPRKLDEVVETAEKMSCEGFVSFKIMEG